MRTFQVFEDTTPTLRKIPMTGDRFARLGNFAKKMRPNVPFTELHTVLRCLKKNTKSILDIGCGTGQPMKVVNKHHKFQVTGIDAFQPSLDQCEESGVYSSLILQDVRSLPFMEKSFDTVICLALIEHLEKEEGEKLLRNMENIAKKQVILTTPVGEYKQGPLDGNPNQEHKSQWFPREFKDKGYTVRGVGIRGVMGEGALFSRLARTIGAFRWIPWLLAGPIVYFIPELAGTQVCWKNIDG